MTMQNSLDGSPAWWRRPGSAHGCAWECAWPKGRHSGRRKQSPLTTPGAPRQPSRSPRDRWNYLPSFLRSYAACWWQKRPAATDPADGASLYTRRVAESGSGVDKPGVELVSAHQNRSEWLIGRRSETMLRNQVDDWVGIACDQDHDCNDCPQAVAVPDAGHRRPQ